MSSRAAGKESARARAAEQRAAQARVARRRRLLLAGGAIALVVAVIAGLVIANVAGVGGSSGTDSTTAASSSRASAAVVKNVTTVPAATLDTVGAGDIATLPKKIDAPRLKVDGKPQFLYVGADYCPFCASERWPVVVALSRFGTWSALGATSSGSTDVHPDTQTLSFHGAGFTSKYVSFTGVETRGNTIRNGEYEPLDSMNPVDQKVFDTYNRPPYVGSAGSIPFVDVAGTYVSVGSSYSPELLKGKSREQIAAALADPKSAIGRAVNGSANVITAALCGATGQQPAAVCGSAGVKAGGARLAAGG